MTAQLPLERRSTTLTDDAALAGARADGGPVAHAVGRLAAEFPGRHVAIVSATVARCRRDLDGAPPGAMPELLERLARQRLHDSS